MSTCYIGLGANLGNARNTIERAIAQIGVLPGVRIGGRSRLYRSAPVDAQGPDFLNAVIRLETTRSPLELLSDLQQIENVAGRERPYRNAPRTLDLDLLLYDALKIELPTLLLPHPRMHLRAFVLRPLLELDTGIDIPGRGLARTLLEQCTDQRVEPLEASAQISKPGTQPIRPDIPSA